jgi:signal transduction histidine kinase/ActR/RegA family two-component response regulator
VSAQAGEACERRLLLLAPFGRDGELLQKMLRQDDVESEVCASLAALALETERGAAALLIAEEAIGRDADVLGDLIARQPPWSDLPVIVMTQRGSDSPTVARALELLGNVILIERPVRIPALRSAVRTALRARERQYQMRARLEEREEADQRKDEFLAVLAHELRNPLAPIRNTINILRLSSPLPPVAKLWEMMDRQVSHMVRLVDDLLEVSRITRGKIELRREALELSLIIATAVETSRPLIEAGRHELTVSLPPEPLVVDADATRLAQVFANLLNNSAKYTDPGGTISIAAAREGGEVIVAVRDSGVGIRAEALGRVFDMFVQVDGGAQRGPGGLGIGLTLARRLVEMHGGSISAASDGIGAGSVFTVRLPLAATASARAPQAPTPAAMSAGGPRVLVVDDNRDAADSLGQLLELMGAEVCVVYNGESALEGLVRHRPAIVFLDIGMPHMDGYEVARRMRAQEEARATRLVALTGWGQEKDRRLSAAAGFDHHLTKPPNAEELRELLASAASAQPQLEMPRTSGHSEASSL